MIVGHFLSICYVCVFFLCCSVPGITLPIGLIRHTCSPSAITWIGIKLQGWEQTWPVGQIGEPSGFAVGRESELCGLFVVALLPQWRVSVVCCSLSVGLVLFVCGSFCVNITHLCNKWLKLCSLLFFKRPVLYSLLLPPLPPGHQRGGS